MIITVTKLIKKIDKLYFGLILCEKKNVTQATIIENNNSRDSKSSKDSKPKTNEEGI